MTDLVICLLYYGLLAVTVGLCLAHAVLANARTRRLARIFLVVGPLPAVVTSVYALIRIFIGISPGVDPLPQGNDLGRKHYRGRELHGLRDPGAAVGRHTVPHRSVADETKGKGGRRGGIEELTANG